MEFHTKIQIQSRSFLFKLYLSYDLLCSLKQQTAQDQGVIIYLHSSKASSDSKDSIRYFYGE